MTFGGHRFWRAYIDGYSALGVVSVHCLCDLDIYNPQFVTIGARDQD